MKIKLFIIILICFCVGCSDFKRLLHQIEEEQKDEQVVDEKVEDKEEIEEDEPINLNTLTIANNGVYGMAKGTMPSIMNAMYMCDGVRIPVRKTKDNMIVVFEDESTLDACGIDFKISEKNYYELVYLNIQGQRIPLLQDVLNAMPYNKKLFIDIKTGVDETISIVNNYSKDISFIGYDYNSLRYIKQNTFNKCYFIKSANIDNNINLNIDGLGFDYLFITDKLIRSLIDLNLEIIACNINNIDKYDELKNKVSFIITDHPEFK